MESLAENKLDGIGEGSGGLLHVDVLVFAVSGLVIDRDDILLSKIVS